MKRSSLPTETKEEGRKRKQFRTLRWMEAKRRRSDKQLAMMENESGDGSADSGIGMQCKYNNNEIGQGKEKLPNYSCLNIASATAKLVISVLFGIVGA
ncbi:hypothetical protein PIB30_034958 [Stylosanthes scabra]|uniref:Uncharacterized protein n=1 Tax=Stylosanthes scabra TaxID=79078 RepID=A0ABU6YDM0_9FABA|nr:hypothetical protein [Stylosanthes scabra]